MPLLFYFSSISLNKGYFPKSGLGNFSMSHGPFGCIIFKLSNSYKTHPSDLFIIEWKQF
jgi:hypothetical protein